MLYRIKDGVMIETKYLTSIMAYDCTVFVKLLDEEDITLDYDTPEDAKSRVEVIAAAIDRLNGLD